MKKRLTKIPTQNRHERMRIVLLRYEGNAPQAMTRRHAVGSTSASSPASYPEGTQSRRIPPLMTTPPPRQRHEWDGHGVRKPAWNPTHASLTAGPSPGISSAHARNLRRPYTNQRRRTPPPSSVILNAVKNPLLPVRLRRAAGRFLGCDLDMTKGGSCCHASDVGTQRRSRQ